VFQISTTGVATNTGIPLTDDFRALIYAGSAAYTMTEDSGLSVISNHVLLNDYDADADELS
jgi:hypothetical protein